MRKKLLYMTSQALVMLIASFGVYLLMPLKVVHALLRWAGLPLLGAVSAYLLARKGVNAYLTWELPPAMHTLGAFAASMGYLPGAGAVLLTAFFSLAGAAAAETMRTMKKKRRR